MRFYPRAYQKTAIEKIKENKRYALFLGMGLGKTSAVLAALKELDRWPVLVIAPLRVANTTWPDEVGKWDDFSNISVSRVTGNAANRLDNVKKDAHIHTINYENLEWLVNYWGKKWPYKTVVADELSKLKGFRLRQGTKRAKALARVAFTCVDRFIGLTGTPNPNGLKDLWGQLWFLDKGERLGKTFTAFTERWFRIGYDGFSMDPLPNAQNEIQNLISDMCLSVRTEDYFDIKTPIVDKIYIDLPKTAYDVYKKMEKEMIVMLGENTVSSPNAAALTMKCLQIANGFLYDETGDVVPLHDEKLQALNEIVEEVNSNLLVVYFFKEDLLRLQKAYPNGRTLKTDGDIRDWNDGKINILFIHPASAGHGLSLQHGGHHIVFYGHTWNLEEYLQVLERIGPVRQLQSGYNRNVFVYHLIAKNTIEESVIERLESKKSVQDILLNFLSKTEKSS